MVPLMDLEVDQGFEPIAPSLQRSAHPRGGFFRIALRPADARPYEFSREVMLENDRRVSQKERAGWNGVFVVGEPEQVLEQANGFERVGRFKQGGKAAPGVTGLQGRASGMGLEITRFDIAPKLHQPNLGHDAVQMKPIVIGLFPIQPRSRRVRSRGFAGLHLIPRRAALGLWAGTMPAGQGSCADEGIRIRGYGGFHKTGFRTA